MWKGRGMKKAYIKGFLLDLSSLGIGTNSFSFFCNFIPQQVFIMRLIALVSFAASVFAASRTTAPSGSIVVAKSGGDYSTVCHSINSGHYAC